MPIFGLSNELVFPRQDLADESGILAVGGDLKPDRLLLAYAQGIFPWPHQGYPLLWFCPADRFVLPLRDFHVSRALRKTMRKEIYQVRFDTCFTQVMIACQSTHRPGQNRTWITDEIIEGFSALHQLGFAHSVEAFEGSNLVGGLYGVSLGGVFFGESMFSTKPEASKTAFATLIAHLMNWNFDLVDCQTQTQYLASFGARLIPRLDFLKQLETSHLKATRQGRWSCELSTKNALDKIVSWLASGRDHR